MNLKTTLTAVCSATLLLQTPRLLAQDDATPPPMPAASAAPAASPAPGGGGNADFRQRMLDRLKTALKATDEEWAVIAPLMEKVQTAQRETMSSRFGGFGGGFGRRGGGGGGGAPGENGGGGGGGQNQGNRPPRPTSPEADALRTALETDGTSTEEIKTKLQALRDARKKGAADLEQAREDLKKVLTLRQEAVLVQMGLLE